MAVAGTFRPSIRVAREGWAPPLPVHASPLRKLYSHDDDTETVCLYTAMVEAAAANRENQTKAHKPYVCPLCKRRFATQDGRLAHTVSYHRRKKP